MRLTVVFQEFGIKTIEEIKNMNKMKAMVIAVLVLVVGSLHAQTKVNESKLTNLSYVKKTYKTKYKCVFEDGVYYYSSDGKAGFLKSKVEKGVFVKMGVVNVADEVYGRVVFHEPGAFTFTCNLHDTEYSVKGKLAAYVNKEDAEELVKEMKDFAIDLATSLKKEN